jgi:hypothetical protein
MNKNLQNLLVLMFLPVIMFIGIFICIGEDVYWFFKDKRLLCRLGFHKYYCKTYENNKFTYFYGEFYCKYCNKIINKK